MLLQGPIGFAAGVPCEGLLCNEMAGVSILETFELQLLSFHSLPAAAPVTSSHLNLSKRYSRRTKGVENLACRSFKTLLELSSKS